MTNNEQLMDQLVAARDLVAEVYCQVEAGTAPFAAYADLRVALDAITRAYLAIESS